MEKAEPELHALKLGDVVRAKADTLAAYCGDTIGLVVQFDGKAVMCRMKQSGRTVPFRRDQLEHLAVRSMHDVR